MSSITENSSSDLKAARILLHKIGTTFTNFQYHTLSIFSLGEEWKTLQNSFARVHSSLESRVKEIESKEREITSHMNSLQFSLKEVELRANKLAFDEKSLSDRVKFVEIREKQVKEWCESLALEKRLLDERRKAVEVIEKRFSGGMEEGEGEGEIELKKREEAVSAKEKVVSEKDDKLNELCKGLKLKEIELNSKESRLEKNRIEIELKENELNEGLMAKEGEINARVLEFERKEVEFEENRKELELKEKEVKELNEVLRLREGEMNAMVLALQQKEVKFREDRKHVDELFDVLHLNEKKVNEKSELLAIQEKEIEARCREVEAKEKELGEKSEELKAKEKQINDSCDVLETQGKKVDDQHQRLVLKEVELDELRQKTLVKDKQVNEWFEELGSMRKDADERCEEAERKAKEAMNRANALNCKCIKAGKKIVHLTKELKLKEKELNEHWQTEESKEKQGNGSSMLTPCQSKEFIREETQIVSWSNEQTDQDIGQVSCAVESLPSTCDDLHSMCKNMDVVGVRSYLMERVQEQKKLHEKMLGALRCAPDPAKFALDVFRSFHIKFKNKCQIRANKASCIFVLEQLMKLSSRVTYEVKVGAKKFAEYFRGTLKTNNSATDSLGFLLLLATFKLANFYTADDLVSLFKVYYCGGDLYQLEENSYLCNELGILDKIPGLVTSLTEKKKYLSAIKFICIFKLEHEFPLEPLLQAQLDNIRDKVKESRKHRAFKSKSEAIQSNTIELNSLNELIKHIRVFKLEPIFPIDSLVLRVNELEKKKEGSKANPNVAPMRKHDADSCASVNSAAAPNQPEKCPNVGAPTKKRNADSCASVGSVAMSNQLEKRPRVGDVPQAAPLERAPYSPPMPYSLGHAAHVNPNVQPTWQQGPNGFSSYGVGPHMGSAPFVPPGVYPFGASRPYC